MKIVTSLIALGTLSLSAATFECNVEKATQWGEVLIASGMLTIDQSIADSVRSINVNGKIVVDYEFNSDEEPCYQADFINVSAVENMDYKPRKEEYKSFSQFKDVDTANTSKCDGGFMSGYLLLDKEAETKETFNAYYIFQAGDHMGGKIHLSCK